jgi:hypothetical protein
MGQVHMRGDRLDTPAKASVQRRTEQKIARIKVMQECKRQGEHDGGRTNHCLVAH